MGIPEISTFLQASGIDLTDGQALDPFTIASRLEGHFSQDEIRAFLRWLSSPSPLRHPLFPNSPLPLNPWTDAQALDQVRRLPPYVQQIIFRDMFVRLDDQSTILQRLCETAPHPQYDQLKKDIKRFLDLLKKTQGYSPENAIDDLTRLMKRFESLADKLSFAQVGSLVAPTSPSRFKPSPHFSSSPTLLVIGVPEIGGNTNAIANHMYARSQIIRAYLENFPNIRIVVSAGGGDLDAVHQFIETNIGSENLNRVGYALRTQTSRDMHPANYWMRDGLMEGSDELGNPLLGVRAQVFADSPTAWNAVHELTEADSFTLGFHPNFQGGQYLHLKGGATLIGSRELLAMEGFSPLDPARQGEFLAKMADGIGQKVGMVGHPLLGQTSYDLDLAALELGPDLIATPDYAKGWNFLKTLSPAEIDEALTAYHGPLGPNQVGGDPFIEILRALKERKKDNPLLQLMDHHVLPHRVRLGDHQYDILRALGLNPKKIIGFPIPTPTGTLGIFNSTVHLDSNGTLVMMAPRFGRHLDGAIAADLQRIGFQGRIVNIPGTARFLGENEGGPRCLTYLTSHPLRGRPAHLISAGDVPKLLQSIKAGEMGRLVLSENIGLSNACIQLAREGFIPDTNANVDALYAALAKLHGTVKPHGAVFGFSPADFDEPYWKFLAHFAKSHRFKPTPRSLAGALAAFVGEKRVRSTPTYQAMAVSLARSAGARAGLPLILLGSILTLEDAAQAVNFCLGLFSEQKETEHSGLASTLMPGLTALADRFA